MDFDGKLKFRSHNTSYCLIEVLMKENKTQRVELSHLTFLTITNYKYLANYQIFGLMINKYDIIIHVLVLYLRYTTVNKQLESIKTTSLSLKRSQVQCFSKTNGKLFAFAKLSCCDTTKCSCNVRCIENVLHVYNHVRKTDLWESWVWAYIILWWRDIGIMCHINHLTTNYMYM